MKHWPDRLGLAAVYRNWAHDLGQAAWRSERDSSTRATYEGWSLQFQANAIRLELEHRAWLKGES